MKNKAIALSLVAMLAISAMGCSSNNIDEKTTENNQRAVVENLDILPGKWSEDYTREEVKELYEKSLASVESTAKGYSLDYDITEDEIKEENGESVNDTYVYFDIPDAERLESLYFGFKQYGSDLANGKLEMKLGYKLDKQIYDAIKNGTDEGIETITNNVDGLKETITITEDFLLYKLESRVYNFK